jgi:hypothetical protein
MQLEGSETPKEPGISNETFTPSPKGFMISITPIERKCSIEALGNQLKAF